MKMSNQAFARGIVGLGQAAQNTIHFLGKILAGPKAQIGLDHILEGQQASVSHNL
jgi:hypothetical protein